MNSYKLTVSYDGTKYNGWQRLGNSDNTIQFKIESVLSRVLDKKVEVSGSGRTDAGVHARKQVCSFQAETSLDCEKLLGELRRYLPQDIGAMELTLAPPRFHARLNCIGKTYLYRIWMSDTPNVFERNYLYVYPESLDSAKPNGIHTPLLAAEGPFEYNSTKKGRITKCQKAVIFMDRTT